MIWDTQRIIRLPFSSLCEFMNDKLNAWLAMDYYKRMPVTEKYLII